MLKFHENNLCKSLVIVLYVILFFKDKKSNKKKLKIVDSLPIYFYKMLKENFKFVFIEK